MALINSCLKRTFIAFNLFFTLVGGVIISLALLMHSLSYGEASVQGRTSGLVGLYIMGTITMLIALLGVYGAYKEHKVSLIVFLVSMVLGALVMLRAGIPTAIARPEVVRLVRQQLQTYLPLNKADDDVKHLADTLQSQLHCCGLDSYRDWNGEIPDSCICPPMAEETVECKEVVYSDFFRANTKSIYSQPCLPIILRYVTMVVDIIIGVVFSLASLAVLGMILSSIMVHQLRFPQKPTIVLSIPAIFTSGPPKYQELHDDPPPPY